MRNNVKVIWKIYLIGDTSTDTRNEDEASTVTEFLHLLTRGLGCEESAIYIDVVNLHHEIVQYFYVLICKYRER